MAVLQIHKQKLFCYDAFLFKIVYVCVEHTICIIYIQREINRYIKIFFTSILDFDCGKCGDWRRQRRKWNLGFGCQSNSWPDGSAG